MTSQPSYDHSVDVTNLNFAYSSPTEKTPVLFDVNLHLKPGSRCIILGANGAGKSTLLSILAGRHLVEKDTALVLGGSAYHQTLGLSGVSYLGSTWTRTIAFSGNHIPYQADIPVRDMMRSVQEEFSERRDKLMTMLEIDPEWKMHLISDGQRRRVQIMLGLLRPFKLLLVDEMTVDLDVLARKEFLDYLKLECEQNNATVLYATHIYDAMDGWASHIAHMEAGKISKVVTIQDIAPHTLYQHAVQVLTEQRQQRRLREQERKDLESDDKQPTRGRVEPFADRPNSGFTPGRMLAYFAK